MIRILIMVAKTPVRENITQILSQSSEIEIVGVAGEKNEAIIKLQQLQPDVLLLDLNMPEVNILEFVNTVSRQQSHLSILLLAEQPQPKLLQESLKAGARGYVLTGMSEAALTKAIKLANVGYTGVRPTLSVEAINNNSLASRFHWSSRFTSGKVSEDWGIANSSQFLPSLSNWQVFSGVTCIGVFMVGVFLSSVLRYKITVQAPATVLAVGELSRISASVEGKIAAVSVTTQAPVVRGELLVQVESDNWQQQQQKLQENLQEVEVELEALEGQMGQLEQRISTQKSLLEQNLAQARAQLRSQELIYQENLISTRARLGETEVLVTLAQEELRRYGELAEAGAVSQAQLQAKEGELKRAIAEYQQIKNVLAGTNDQITTIQEQILRQQNNSSGILEQLEQEYLQLRQQQAALNEQARDYQAQLAEIEQAIANSKIRSPITGTVVELFVEQDQTIAVGDPVAVIFPETGIFRFQVEIAAADIGKINQGQRVTMGFSSCAEDNYRFQGTILTNISSLLTGEDSLKETYKIAIQPDEVYLTSEGCTWQPEMKGKAYIITKEETLWQFMLRQVLSTDQRQ